MEERDTQNINNASNGQSIKDGELEALYRKNNSMSFILKKTEKIVTAVYMVTDFMSELEPLRYELRTLGITLLSKTRQLSTKATEPDYGIIDDMTCGSDGLCSLIQLAVTIGLISNMNGNILLNELQKNSNELRNLFSDRRVSVTTHPGYSNIILKKEMFEVPYFETPKIEVFNKGQLDKGHNMVKNVLYKKPEKDEIKKENSAKASGLGIKIARRNDVLNIVKVKGQVSVKDIILMLKDVSEKTVQRELFSLVKEGVLKKEGEKRWSVYKLV